jgi:putative serine protease PepD
MIDDVSTTPPYPPHMQPPGTTWGSSSNRAGTPDSYGPPPTPSQRPGTDPNGAGPFGSDPDTGTHDRRPPRRGVWVAAAALLAGAIGGVGGAAGYSAFSDDSTSQVRDALTAPVVDTGNTSSSGTRSVEAVAAAVLPSVVKISVSSASAAGSGSGIVLTSDGLILTNNHVAAIAAHGGNIAVSFNDGTDATAHIVGRDPLTDLAVIQAEGVSGLTPATLGTSSSLRVGEQVVAIGSPFGLDSTVTSGIVSALDRPVDASNNAPRPSSSDSIFAGIQTDAAINPGNSGGALVNMHGQVIGINSAIYSPTSSDTTQGGSVGLGFAIPIDEARPIAEQLRNGETATHARLGVSIQDATNSEGLVDGAKVQDVTAGSAAAAAGLNVGDVITSIGGQPVTGADSLVALVRTYRPDDKVSLGVTHDGNTQTFTVTLGSDATQS